MSIALALLAPPQGSFNGVDNDQKMARIYFTITPSGNYPALGDPMDFTSLGDAIMSGQPPLLVVIQSAKTGGLSGYQYGYTPGNPATQANGKFQVLVGGGGTPAGTLSAPTITTLVNASTANPVAVTGGALTSTTGEVGVTGVQAPVFTGTPGTAGPDADLGAEAYPAGVTGDTIIGYADFPRL